LSEKKYVAVDDESVNPDSAQRKAEEALKGGERETEKCDGDEIGVREID
jgi:hypothetical protein